MPCGLSPNQCRRDHVAGCLDDTEADGTDFEARCPKCGHGGFRISRPTRSKYRHIWVCACKRCRCTASELRAALLQHGVPLACLGLYDGPVQKTIPPDVARRLDLAVRDILAVPQIPPADIRLTLAEAQGREVPEVFRPFVKFAVSIGIGATQAKEAAKRWCRPPDSRPPQTGGQGVDTSRSTDAIGAVKLPASEDRDRSETDCGTVGNRPTDIPDISRSDIAVPRNVRKSETGNRTLGDNKNRRPAA